jgi:hypothetical protein
MTFEVSDMQAYDLAMAILGLPDDTEDDVVNRALWVHCGVDFEDFKSIVNLLTPLAMIGDSALTGAKYRGFAKDGWFIVKQEVG